MKKKNAIVKTKSYDIVIGHDNFDVLASFVAKGRFSSVFVLTDKAVSRLYAEEVKRALPRARFITIPAGEKRKTLATLETVWKRLFAMGADRHSLLVNLGGGVIGDMGGLAAALYMRGMRFVHVPTTLLAQVDASVGGKTAVNLSCCKNIIGSFAQPSLVLINVATLKTLPRREFLSGMAEVLKHGLIRDRRYLNKVVQTRGLHDLVLLEAMVRTSCQIKADIVNRDERETGERKILNFGHTVGHAIETLSRRTRHPLL
ncbi:MAG: 3-dehydroquinate synthase, partial [Kiritimatiellaeota bacterium]|nr:3-dehydroquinate synthase [Kiritimatiellota bacterium]